MKTRETLLCQVSKLNSISLILEGHNAEVSKGATKATKEMTTDGHCM
jgi:hypothetical protein